MLSEGHLFHRCAQANAIEWTGTLWTALEIAEPIGTGGGAFFMGETTLATSSSNDTTTPVTNSISAASTSHPSNTATQTSSGTYVSSYGSLKFPSFDGECDWNVGPGDALQPDSSLDYDIPFAPFLKSEKLSRIADWSSPVAEGASYRRNFVRPTAPRVEEEESGWTFATADAKSISRDKKPSSGFGASAGRYQGSGRDSGRGGYGMRGGGAPRRTGGWGPRFGDRQAQRKRDPSILVSPEWKVLEEIEFSRLSKLQLDPDDAVHAASTGKANLYDRVNDKVSVKNEKLLHVPLSTPLRLEAPALEEDKTLLDLTAANEAAVIVSDYVASILMAAPRTVVPWDIVIKRRGKVTILDARPESNLDLLPINETAPESPLDSSSDSLNSSAALAREAARIKHHLSSFLSKSGSEASCSLRYSTLDLGDGAVVNVRSQVPAVLNEAGDAMHLTTLLEYEHKGAASMEWKLKLDTQRGAVFAHEIRNNGALLARTVYQSLLAAVDHIKLAYVTRVSPKDPTRHTLLGLHEFEPYELASQMNLNVANGFGILRALVDIFRRLPTNCDYSLMRDPNKPMLRLYKLPGGEVNELDETIDDLVTATNEIHISEAESSVSDMMDD